ncbi:MAG: hypothetical protein IPH13_20425 [Planctomycetes bacterium]|nr:hypothetical protein [Planctomycetota bacterium]
MNRWIVSTLPPAVIEDWILWGDSVDPSGITQGGAGSGGLLVIGVGFGFGAGAVESGDSAATSFEDDDASWALSLFGDPS